MLPHFASCPARVRADRKRLSGIDRIHTSHVIDDLQSGVVEKSR